MTKNISTVMSESGIIKNETTVNANTATRVGTNLVDLGENIQDILSEIHPPLLSGLTYTDKNPLIRFNTVLSNLVFTWTEVNSPADLVLSDSANKMGNINVGGMGYTGDKSYSIADADYITWTLSSTNASSVSTYTRFVYPSYFGVNTDGDTPTLGEITAESELIKDTRANITVTPNNEATQHVWVAVPVTGSAFTTWFNVVGNEGNIGSGEAFELKTSTMAIHGVNYEVYVQSSPSAWSGNLKLQ